jgi:ADP-ribose pyrophosphatase YjhB (NUDIX family)
MWEFPHAELRPGETPRAAAARLLGGALGIRGRLEREVATLSHAVTRHRIKLVCFQAHYESGEFRSEKYEQARWVTKTQLTLFPVSAPQRLLAQALGERRSKRENTRIAKTPGKLLATMTRV